MKMTEFQDKVIRITVKTQLAVIITVVSVVSSFWGGVSVITAKQNTVIAKLDSLAHKQEIKDIRQDARMERGEEKLEDLRNLFAQLTKK